MSLMLDLLLGALSLSLALCLVRLYRGPDVPDRAVSFDLAAAHAVGLFVLLAVRTGNTALLDGAIITLVLGFAGTLMLARFLEAESDDGSNRGSP